jgi:hypothetical protein
MATRDLAPRPRRWVQWAAGLVLIAWSSVPAMAQIATLPPPVTPGQARIWLYRPLEPYGSLNLARIDVNGSYFASVANGSALYRDIPAGHYHIAPVSFGRDFNQDKDVDLASGQQLYIKIVSLEDWGVSVSGSRSIRRDTFYAWLISPDVAQVEIARQQGGT